MYVLKANFSAALTILSVAPFLSDTSAMAQVKLASAEEISEDKSGEFVIENSIQIGMGGVQYKTHFRLADEGSLGFDTMSLLANVQLRQSIGLDEKTFFEISETYQTETSEMIMLIPTSKREDLETRFRTLEADLRSNLDQEQLQLLQQARVRKSITKNGLAKTLGMGLKLELSEEETKALEKATSDAKREIKKRSAELQRAANKELLAQLNADQLEKFKSLVNKKDLDQFLNGKLFVSSGSLKRNRGMRTLLAQLRIKRVRKQLELSDQQTDDIEALNKKIRSLEDDEIESSGTEILSPQQIDRAVAVILRKEIAKYGTVKSLSFGFISNRLDLNEQNSKDLHQAGKEISRKLEHDIQQARIESWKSAVEILPAEKKKMTHAFFEGN